MNKISAVYRIVNTVTGEFYIGSSVDVKKRWANHKCPSKWGRYPNNKMYQDMQEHGLDCFSFEILEEVEPGNLRQAEQKFIETLKPTYNQMYAKGWDVERQKASHRKYRQSKKGKETKKKYSQSEKYKAARNIYSNQLCEYNGETLTLNALGKRFHKAGIPHSVLEAKKYLINK